MRLTTSKRVQPQWTSKMQIASGWSRQRDALQAEERQLLSRTTAMVMQEQERRRARRLCWFAANTISWASGGAGRAGVFAAARRQARRQTGLGFAQWLVDPRHPLTARVAVNRHWRQVFGEGLVATVEDFGVRGEPPSHPELLDWLAVEFVASGLGREAAGAAAGDFGDVSAIVARDAGELGRRSGAIACGRGPSRARLDAEVIRDSALAAAGLLCEQVGGPSVKPYQPADLWKHITYDRKNTQSYDQSTGEGLFRRSLYTYWKRQIPPPTMQLLDAPTRETCVLRRQRTNTPLQALALLNDVQFVEAARGLATRMIAAAEQRSRSGSTTDFRLVTARSADSSRSGRRF